MSAIISKMNNFYKKENTVLNTNSRVLNKVNQNDPARQAPIGKKIIVCLKTAGALLASPFLATAVMVDKVVADIQFAVKNGKTDKANVVKRLFLSLPLAIAMGMLYLPVGAIQQVKNAMAVCKKEVSTVRASEVYYVENEDAASSEDAVDNTSSYDQ